MWKQTYPFKAKSTNEVIYCQQYDNQQYNDGSSACR